ncbi:tetratricopeptide repeat protein [candidate division KSB1 bacterium]|nr:tetratricopeptide repeat protein [candidate division KSB1 bacterium]
MKRSLLIFLIGLILVGCAGTGYGPAEKSLKNQDYNQAIREYLKVLNPHSRDGKRYIYYEKEAFTGIGSVYWHMEKYETAIKILKPVLEKNPEYGKALYYLGLSYEGLGQEIKAQNAYKKYPNIYVNDPFRSVIVGRLDYIRKRTSARQIQQALDQEKSLRFEDLPQQSVAIMYFMNLSNSPEYRPLQTGLAELIIQDLNQVEGIEAVDRFKLNALMAEMNLNVEHLSNESWIARFSKLLNVSTIVTGSYMISADMRMTLDANLYEASEIMLPERVEFDGSLARIFRTQKELVIHIVDQLGLELTIQQRENLIQIPTENMMAFLKYCRGLEAIDYGDYLAAQEFFQEAISLDPRFYLALDWLMLPEMWQATHNQNLNRVNYEVMSMIKTTSRGQTRLAYTPKPELVSTWNRLQWLAMRQNAGLIPGNDTRKAFVEAIEFSADLLPELLAEPPRPAQ